MLIVRDVKQNSVGSVALIVVVMPIVNMSRRMGVASFQHGRRHLQNASGLIQMPSQIGSHGITDGINRVDQYR
jgi:hypothetical protein